MGMTENEYLLKRIAELEAQLGTKQEKKPRVESKGQATRALTESEYIEFIETMKNGFAGAWPNPGVAMALSVEAATGIRISDVLQLRPSSIVHYDGNWHFDIIEQKTRKPRKFVVQDYVATNLKLYCAENGIKGDELIFPFRVRNVQARVKNVAEYLGLKNIGTHSFRKFFATKIYTENGYDIVLLQKIMQHSSAAITQRYIGVDQKKINEALTGHIVKM